MKRIIISIDGLAGTGKTSISERLSQRLGFLNFSTGVVYRAAGYLALKELPESEFEDEQKCLDVLSSHSLQLATRGERTVTVLVDGKDVFEHLYASAQVSEATSKVARFQTVREALLDLQRSAFPGQSMVVEGRDIGSVVFPGADLKFFLSTAEDVKVHRRLRQMEKLATSPEQRNSLKEQIKIEIHERDLRDRTRPYSPTICQPDMVEIDNSADDLEFVVEKMYNHVLEKGIRPHQS